jgi:hypothetical protein
MGNDCLVALAYIAAREGDQARAAALLEPVLADGRLREYLMYWFVMRFLSGLQDALAGVTLDPPLPSTGEFFARIGALLYGAAPAETGAESRIEAALLEFVS